MLEFDAAHVIVCCLATLGPISYLGNALSISFLQPGLANPHLRRAIRLLGLLSGTPKGHFARAGLARAPRGKPGTSPTGVTRTSLRLKRPRARLAIAYPER